MDLSLFKKHFDQIDRQKNNKEELVNLIKEKTGIVLDESMITLSKKEVTLHLSSVAKHKLFQSKLEEVLKEKGYILKK